MRLFLAATLALAPLAAATLPVAAHAQAAPAADPAASKFIEGLASNAFSTLRDPALSQADRISRFRALLKENVALDAIGNRLIRRQRAEITDAQYKAYQAAFPEFILNTYADRLQDYKDASLKTMRTVARGPFTEVHTRVSLPGSQPVDAIWQVRKSPAGKYQINNLTVSNINLSITQEADFANYIKTNGFDALVSFLKSANAKAASGRTA
ncbi:MlaC/ttg2D family ABC transporter substrate-binding protein [Polymorphobacter sp.]|uniref:MlaC/ttg2D family ABC transporter substrate-binding protein n=1 Tax=Polymorphobacter sp. TaxID=1909290 RepID=UPI003F6E7761